MHAFCPALGTVMHFFKWTPCALLVNCPLVHEAWPQVVLVEHTSQTVGDGWQRTVSCKDAGLLGACEEAVAIWLGRLHGRGPSRHTSRRLMGVRSILSRESMRLFIGGCRPAAGFGGGGPAAAATRYLD